MAIRSAVVHSPVGLLLIEGHDAVEKIHMLEGSGDIPSDRELSDDAFDDAREQLEAYFRGDLTEFSLELSPRGTPFQQAVWGRLRKIPFGETVSYGEVARDIGTPTAYRAVGAATGRNPIGIVVPCHRVVGAAGQLTGYAGGLHRKKALLAHETEVISKPRLTKIPA